MSESIESRTASAILQTPKEITIGEKSYNVAPPSCATLILASEAVSHLPHTKLNSEDLIGECLSIAKDCRPLGDVLAILILGARGLTERREKRETIRKKRLWGLLPDRVKTIVTTEIIDHKKALSDELLSALTPRELNNLAARLLKMMQLGDFFGLTTFLLETNLIRPTKVENPIAFGQ